MSFINHQETYKLCLIKKSDSDDNSNVIGYISYIISNNKSINISGLYINDTTERGKGYGYGLLILFLCYIIKHLDNAYFIKTIHLDDCSDNSLTKQSLYYKFGFRISDDSSMEIMRINFLNPRETSSYIRKRYHIYDDETEASIVYYESIIDLYKNVLAAEKYTKIIKDIHERIKSDEIFVSIYKYNNEENKYELHNNKIDVNSCLNIDKEIESNSHNTRSSSKRSKTII
jgi:hypothetical protein